MTTARCHFCCWRGSFSSLWFRVAGSPTSKKNEKKQVLFLLFGSVLLEGLAEDAKPVVLGITSHDAEKYNVEFLKYDRRVSFFREHGIRAALVDSSPFVRRELPADRFYKELEKFHVIHLTTPSEGIPRLTPALERRARTASAALARYVREGGGLFIQCQPVRYANNDDEK